MKKSTIYNRAHNRVHKQKFLIGTLINDIPATHHKTTGYRSGDEVVVMRVTGRETVASLPESVNVLYSRLRVLEGASSL